MIWLYDTVCQDVHFEQLLKGEESMEIEIKSFMGRIGFEMRRKCPKISSWGYLHLQAFLRKNSTNKFIKKVMEKPEEMVPLFVNVETINRCNGTCPFCPANVKDESRDLKKMTWELFEKILTDLDRIDYNGVLSLYVNNEPFLDNRMEKMLLYAREKLPHAVILIFTNGTVLTTDCLEKIDGSFDRMYINNYNINYEMNENVKKIYKYIREEGSKKTGSKITIQLRYAREYLANRAGTAPNKHAKGKYTWQCLMPYTDMTIFPDGTVGLCCNDTKEVTNYGNVSEDDLLKVFRNEKLTTLRKALMRGRDKNSYCRCCDVVDSGIRLRFVKTHMV